MELLHTPDINSNLLSKEEITAKTCTKRKPEVDLLTDDQFRQMLGSVGANYQIEELRKRKICHLTQQLTLN